MSLYTVCTGQQQQRRQQQLQQLMSADSMIAPEHDPLGPVLGLLPREQMEAASLTLGQLQQDYRCTISTLAANIGLLEEHLEQQQQHCASIHMDSSRPGGSGSGGEEAAAAAALSRVQDALQQFWAQLNVLLRGGRAELTHAFIVSNVLTGEQLEQHHPPLYHSAARQLQLSGRQQQRITTALRFFRKLTEPAVLARQQLQQQLQDQPPAAATDAAAAAASVSASASPAGAAAGGCQGRPDDAVKPQHAVLQQQELNWGLQQRRQQQLSRLNILMRKEGTLKHCASTCIQGCLTWTQMAQVGPSAAHPLVTCTRHKVLPVALNSREREMAQVRCNTSAVCHLLRGAVSFRVVAAAGLQACLMCNKVAQVRSNLVSTRHTHRSSAASNRAHGAGTWSRWHRYHLGVMIPAHSKQCAGLTRVQRRNRLAAAQLITLLCLQSPKPASCPASWPAASMQPSM
ncbi:hypothetical protein COO60DRAFT_288358 [Scenedesmus sp. NREL 46B-D3]|nr:hypothetical protein COO60DRAFT_288358 [Scenedesmus sp. NREL 46B-D3]